MESRPGTRRRGPIIVAGPLAPFVQGLRRDLASQGYALDTVGDHVHLLADLSGWLSGRGLSVADLTTQVAGEFLRERRAAGRRVGVTPRGLAPVLEYLRRVRVAPPDAVVGAATPLEILLVEYRAHLVGERGLSAGTATHYLRCARTFLTWLSAPLAQALPAMSAGQVTDYVLGWAARRNGKAGDTVTLPALRSLLRFLHVAGHVPRPLVAAVPAARRRPTHVGVPRATSPDHVRAVLAGCDRASAAGRRDYAILLVLARLGLRAGEVAAITLDDVDWRSGMLLVHGKGSREDALPLPTDVGEAIVSYLRRRPRCECRALFLRVTAPRQGLNRCTVAWVVRAACDRAGLPRVGAHRLRHTAATGMLQAGASLPEIGQVLRHREPKTTAIYAKVDHAALRALARPWPTPGGVS